MHKQKKGQISIFIIMGIIILVIGSIFVYQKYSINKSTSEDDVAFVSQEVPLQFQPVYAYVENCLISTSLDALEIIGEQGGYIDYGDFGFSESIDPTNSDLVEFSPGSDLKVPYWYH